MREVKDEVGILQTYLATLENTWDDALGYVRCVPMLVMGRFVMQELEKADLQVYLQNVYTTLEEKYCDKYLVHLVFEGVYKTIITCQEYALVVQEYANMGVALVSAYMNLDGIYVKWDVCTKVQEYLKEKNIRRRKQKYESIVG